MYVGYPLDYAQGGHKDQILNTINQLEKIGLNIEWLHNEKQNLRKKYEIVHFWTYPNVSTIESIRSKLNSKIVWSTMLPTAGSRSKSKTRILDLAVKLGRKFKHPKVQSIFPNYNNIDRIIVLNELEKRHFVDIWQVSEEKISVIPNGIDDIYFNENIQSSSFDGVIQVGAITQIKNSIEVAKAAKLANLKLKFIGDFRLEDQNYRDEFLKEIDNINIFWEGPKYNKLELASHIKGCLGIIQPSKWESYPLVVTEALALKQKVLLTDSPNLRHIYKDNVFYCNQPNKAIFVKELYEFAKNRNRKEITFKALTWGEVASMVFKEYKKLLGY